MKTLSKKLKFLKTKRFYHCFSLVIIFSLLVYPPTIGSGKTQWVVKPPAPKVAKLTKLDSLKIKLTQIDSLLLKNCSTLIKQQDTIKKIIKTQ